MTASHFLYGIFWHGSIGTNVFTWLSLLMLLLLLLLCVEVSVMNVQEFGGMIGLWTLGTAQPHVCVSDFEVRQVVFPRQHLVTEGTDFEL